MLDASPKLLNFDAFVQQLIESLAEHKGLSPDALITGWVFERLIAERSQTAKIIKTTLAAKPAPLAKALSKRKRGAKKERTGPHHSVNTPRVNGKFVPKSSAASNLVSGEEAKAPAKKQSRRKKMAPRKVKAPVPSALPAA